MFIGTPGLWAVEVLVLCFQVFESAQFMDFGFRTLAGPANYSV